MCSPGHRCTTVCQRVQHEGTRQLLREHTIIRRLQTWDHNLQPRKVQRLRERSVFSKGFFFLQGYAMQFIATMTAWLVSILRSTLFSLKMYHVRFWAIYFVINLGLYRLQYAEMGFLHRTIDSCSSLIILWNYWVLQNLAQYIYECLLDECICTHFKRKQNKN